MRVIDADALPRHGQRGGLVHWKDIAEAPSIDIVRCKECRHWEMRNSPRGWCVVHQGYVLPQYFCADGEREDK